MITHKHRAQNIDNLNYYICINTFPNFGLQTNKVKDKFTRTIAAIDARQKLIQRNPLLKAQQSLEVPHSVTRLKNYFKKERVNA